jgi:ankyrin repeat protein
VGLNRKDNLRQHIRDFHNKQEDAPDGNAKRSCQQDPTGHHEVQAATTASKKHVNPLDYRIGSTVILQAACTGNIGLLERAAKSGVDLNIRGDDGSTPLHCAARAGHASLIKLFLDLGHPSEVRNSWNRTPLHEAVLGQNLEAVRAVLKRNTELSTEVRSRNSVIQLGFENANEHIWMLLIEHLDAEHLHFALYVASKVGNSRAVEELLCMPTVDPNKKFCRRPVPLVIAAKFGHENVVQQLLSRNDTDINIRPSILGLTALQYAAKYGHESVVKVLLSREDLDINTRTWDSGNTAGHFAVLNNHVEVTKLLLQHKDINPNLQDLRGNTPLHCALLKDHIEIAKLLLAHASLHINKGEPYSPGKKEPDETVLEIASRKGQSEIIEILMSRTDIIAPDATAAHSYTTMEDAGPNQPSLSGFPQEFTNEPFALEQELDGGSHGEESQTPDFCGIYNHSLENFSWHPQIAHQFSDGSLAWEQDEDSEMLGFYEEYLGTEEDFSSYSSFAQCSDLLLSAPY